MNAEKEFQILLRRHNFKLVAERTHLKYQNPEGKILVTSKTPSDWRVWHRVLADLKKVIANPVPSSQVMEEERQRKEMEQFIRLTAQQQRPAGVSGAGKKTKSKGCGITYVTKTLPIVTEAQRGQSRLADRRSQIIQEANRQVRALQHRFTATVREVARQDMENCTRAECEAAHEKAVAKHGAENCRTAQEIFDINIEGAIARHVPGLTAKAKKIAAHSGYELTETQECGFSYLIPLVLESEAESEDAAWITRIYHGWLRLMVMPPDDWNGYAENLRAKEAQHEVEEARELKTA